MLLIIVILLAVIASTLLLGPSGMRAIIGLLLQFAMVLLGGATIVAMLGFLAFCAYAVTVKP